MRGLIGLDSEAWGEQDAQYTYANWHKIKEATSRKKKEFNSSC